CTGSYVVDPALIYSWELYSVVWTIVLLPLMLYRPSKLKFSFYLFLIAWLQLIHRPAWTEEKRFVKDVMQLNRGMTPKEVQFTLSRYPVDDDIQYTAPNGFYRVFDPRLGFECCGIIRFKNGVVDYVDVQD